MIEEIREKLDILAANETKEFVKFSEKIINTQKKVLGARVPDMRRIAKEPARTASFNDIVALLDKCNKNIYEEVFVLGIIIACSKLPDDEKIRATEIYLDFVDSWALIDSAVMTKKTAKANGKLWKIFVEKCCKSGKEYVVRFGIVYMMENFIDDENIDFVFDSMREIKHEGYYVKMAIAWLYATAAVKYFDRTIKELQSGNIDAWTVNKAFQKMLESYRIPAQNKEIVRYLRKQAKNQ